MLDAINFPDKPSGVGVSYARTSDYTRRDFVFAPIQTTGAKLSHCLWFLIGGANHIALLNPDDDSFLDRIDDSRDLGVIKLVLWRIQVQHVSARVQEHKSRQILEAQVVHERSKKAGAHHAQCVSDLSA
jgi:hypothetical protein